MLSFWRTVAGEVFEGRRVFLAFVVGHQKGSPGTEQARLLFTENGQQLGTIGGGAMEARLLDDSKAAFKEGRLAPQLTTLEHRSSKESASGLFCGGTQTQVTLIVDESQKTIIGEILERLEMGNSGTLVFDSEGISLGEEELTESAAGFDSQNVHWSAWLGLFNRRRILIVGFGHCGAALARQMDMLGFHVTAVDPREDLFAHHALPSEMAAEFCDYTDAGALIEVNHARLTFAIVMTPSFIDDVAALTGLLSQPFPFIGVMGSPAKIKKIQDELRIQNFRDESLSRITAPVGLSINSDTPEEIAVSVAAQILQITKQASVK